MSFSDELDKLLLQSSLKKAGLPSDMLQPTQAERMQGYSRAQQASMQPIRQREAAPLEQDLRMLNYGAATGRTPTSFQTPVLAGLTSYTDWISRANNLAGRVNQASGVGWQRPEDYQRTWNDVVVEGRKLLDEEQTHRDYWKNNASQYDRQSYGAAMSGLDEVHNWLTGLESNITQQGKYYGQFKSAEAMRDHEYKLSDEYLSNATGERLRNQLKAAEEALSISGGKAGPDKAAKEAKARLDEWERAHFMAEGSRKLGALDDETLALLDAYNGVNDSPYSVPKQAWDYLPQETKEQMERLGFSSAGSAALGQTDAGNKLREKGYSQDEIASLAEYRQFQTDADRARRMAQQTAQATSQNAGTAIANSAISVLLSPMKALGLVESLRGVLPRWLGGYVNPNAPTNINSVWFGPTRLQQTIRGTVTQMIVGPENKNAFWGAVYNGVMSTADSALNMALGGTIAKGLGVTSEAALNSATANTVSWLMGSQVAADTVYEEIQHGRSNAGALGLGIIRGLIEHLTEKYSIENILSDPKSIPRMLAKSFVSEGSEEVASNWANRLVDFVLDNQDELKERIARVKAHGVTDDTEALLLAMAEEDIESFVIGGLSGVAMSGVNMGYRTLTHADDPIVGAQLRAANALGKLTETALSMDPDTQSYKLATEILNKENPTDEEIGALYRTIEREADRDTGKRIKAADQAETVIQAALSLPAESEAHKLAEKVTRTGSRVTDKQVGQLYKAVTDEVDKANIRAYNEAVEGVRRVAEAKPAEQSLDSLVNAYRGLGMKEKAASQKAALVQKVRQGVELTPAEVRALNFTNLEMQRVFTEATGVRIPEGVGRILSQPDGAAQLAADILEQSKAIAAEAQAKAESDVRAKNAAAVDEILAPYRGAREMLNAVDGAVRQMQVAEEAAAAEAAAQEQAAAAEASAAQAQAEVVRKLSEITVTDAETGQPMGFAEFVEKARAQQGGETATDEELQGVFALIAMKQGVIDEATFNNLKEEIINANRTGAAADGGGLSGNAGEHSGERAEAVSGRAGGAEAEGVGRGAAANAGGEGSLTTQGSGAVRENQTPSEREEVNLDQTPVEIVTDSAGRSVMSQLPDGEFQKTTTARTLGPRYKTLGLSFAGMVGSKLVYDNDGRVVARANGETILGRSTVVRLDDARYTGVQLGGHELGHQIIFLQPGAYDAAIIALSDNMTAEDFEELRNAYGVAFHDAYAKTADGRARTQEELDRLYLEEIICDAYGQMDRAGTNASAYHDAVATVLDQAYEVAARINQAIQDAGVRLETDQTTEVIRDVNDLAEKAYRTEGTLLTDKGEAIAETHKNGSTVFSLVTYDDTGREVLRGWLNEAVLRKDLSQQDADDILDTMEQIYETAQLARDSGKYEPFSKWSEAAVVVDSNGRPVFSVVKQNNEYVMNLDFSLVCKKRMTLDAVLNELVTRGAIDSLLLDEAAVVRVNDLIRSYGFETACDLCFVDAKRYRQADVADTFANLYNKYVRMIKPKQGTGVYNFANFGQNDQIDHRDGGIESLPDTELDFSKLEKFVRDNTPAKGAGTVDYRVAKYLLENAEGRVLLQRGDFISTQGLDSAQRENPDIMKLFNSKKGTGGPKSAQSNVQYLNEILSNKAFEREKAYAVGGVRIQSFSDYIPRLVFDYVQMIADLAAKKLPAHSYSKESLYVKQFGLTGIKINMSLVPAVVEDGIAPGLDRNGNYVWMDGQSFGSTVGLTGSGQDGFMLALEIQADPEYGKNCGTIAVGISDEHIRAMMADPRIRMVIPYHKSSLSPIVAAMRNIAAFTDYTSFQNTRKYDKKSGEWKKLDPKVAADKAMLDQLEEVDFNKLMHEGVDPREAAERYVRKCEELGLRPKFDQFAYKAFDGITVEENGQKVVDENYYKLLTDFTVYDEAGNFVPQGDVRMQFPGENSAFGSMDDLIHQGLSEDALLEARRDENVPKIVDDIINGLGPLTQDGAPRETGVRYSLEQNDTDYMAAVERGDMETAQRMVDEAAKAAGYTIKAWHGSRALFNSFSRSERGKNTGTEVSKSWFFAGDYDTANSYYPVGVMTELMKWNPQMYKQSDIDRLKKRGIAGKLYSLYLKMENPLEVDVAGYDYAAHRENADAFTEYTEQANREGRDGVILYHVRDNNLRQSEENSTVYMFRDPEQAKSADPVTYDDEGKVIPLSERFNPAEEDIRYSVVEPDSYAPTFYSKLEQEVDAFKGDKIGAASFVNYLRGHGVKAEEIKWSGIQTFLEGKKSVAKQELLDWLRANRLEIQTEVLDGGDGSIQYTPEEHAQFNELSERRGKYFQEAEELWQKLYNETMPLSIYAAEDSANALHRAVLRKIGDPAHSAPASEEERHLALDIPRMIRAADAKMQDIVDAAKARAENAQRFVELEGTDISVQDYMDRARGFAAEQGLDIEFYDQGNQLVEYRVDPETGAARETSFIPIKNRGQHTHWSDYKLDDGRNYREYLFRMPGSDYSNTAMEAHWERPGVLAHARVQDFSSDGRPVLFVDEIQSDWHNAGQKMGYQTGEAEDDGLIEDSWLRPRKPPEAPYSKNYHEFVLKNLLRQAAENGFDYLAWTTGKMQEERWSDRYAEGYRIEYDQDIPKFLNKYGKQWGAQVTEIPLDETDVFDPDNRLRVPAIPITPEMKQSVLYEGQPRYSISDDLQKWIDLQTQYGVQPESTGSVRPTEVPKRTAPGNKVSHSVPTIMGANPIPEFRQNDMKSAVVGGEFSFTPSSNKVELNKAEAWVKRYGWHDACRDWLKEAERGKTGAYMVARGAVLLNNAANSNAPATEFVELASAYAKLLRASAQSVQAAKILQKLTPEARLYGIQKTVDKLNEELLRKMGIDPNSREYERAKIRIDAALIDAFLRAASEEERDQLMDRMAENVAGQIKSTGQDLFTALRYLNMLGNFRTQIRNLVGNFGFQPVRIAKDILVGAAETALNKAGVKVDRTISAAVDTATWKAAGKVFQEYRKVILAGGKYQDDVGTDFAGRVNDERRKHIFTQTQWQGFNKTVGKVLDKYQQATDWAMDQGDAVFCEFTFRDSLARFMAANHTTWDKASDALRTRAVNKAIRDAAEATYRDNNWLSEWFSHAGRGAGTNSKIAKLAEGIAPFRKTPANILMRAYEYSPLSIIGNTITDIQAARGKKGKAKFSRTDVTANDIIEQWAKTFTGTGLAALGYALAAMGRLIGKAPDDDKEKALFEQQGKQAYSLTLGNHTFTLDWLAPEAIPLFFGANIEQAAVENGLSLREGLEAIKRIGDPILEMSMLQGINDAIDNAATFGNDGALFNLVLNAAWGYVTQGITNTFLGQLERGLQGNQRMQTYVDKNADLPDVVQKALGKTSAKVPGWDYNQIPYIDAWGDPQENADSETWNVITQLFSPAYVTRERQSATLDEISRLYDETGDSGIILDRAPKYFRMDNATINLTADEYVTYAMTRGGTAKAIVADLVESPKYQALPDSQRKEVIKITYDYANQMGKAAVSTFTPEKWVMSGEEAVQQGMSLSDYMLFRASLREHNEGSSSISNAERESAIRAVPGLSNAERDYLWESAGGNPNSTPTW